MTIRSISNPYGAQRVATPTPATSARQDGAATSATAPASGVTPRRDSVSISDAGRSRAGGADTATSAGSLTPERVAALRQKVLGGAYNSTHVVDAVAKRLLSSGDV